MLETLRNLPTFEMCALAGLAYGLCVHPFVAMLLDSRRREKQLEAWRAAHGRNARGERPLFKGRPLY